MVFAVRRLARTPALMSGHHRRPVLLLTRDADLPTLKMAHGNSWSRTSWDDPTSRGRPLDCRLRQGILLSFIYLPILIIVCLNWAVKIGTVVMYALHIYLVGKYLFGCTLHITCSNHACVWAAPVAHIFYWYGI